MLIQFAAENFRSLHHRTELNMRALDNKGGQVTQTFDDLEILRCAALYGANASGKSNLIKAMAFAKQLIVDGTGRRAAEIGTQPFRLADCGRKPSTFEFFFVDATKSIYGYRFAVTKTAVIEEELVRLNEPKETVFSRKGSDFSFGASLKKSIPDHKFLDFVGQGTRPNQLFFYEANERGLDFFKPLREWFTNTLTIVHPSTRVWPLVRYVHNDASFGSFLQKSLRWADIGISDIKTFSQALSEAEQKSFDAANSLEPDVLRGVLKLMEPHGLGGSSFYPTLRKKGDFNVWDFNSTYEQNEPFLLEDESDGTVRLLDLIPVLYYARHNPVVFVVDELDRSLHTLLAQKLVEAFLALDKECSSQLIFSTHDTNLLDCNQLRPDCVWFVEKDKSGATRTYSLAEFKPEQLQELCGNLERGYLDGRFGGIPFLGDPKKLGWLQ